MRLRRPLAIPLALLLLSALRLSGASQPVAASGTTARQIGPTPAAAAAPDFPVGRGFGIFVGVNEFSDPSLTPLKYAVNDAITLADYFVQTGLIEPQNCHLVLSGNAEGTDAQEALARLKQKGVPPISPAYRTPILNLLAETAVSIRNPDDFIVVSFSTHGFGETSENTFLMPADGSKNFSDQTIELESIRRRLHETKARKALFFVDACRSQPVRDTRSAVEPRMTEAFRAAFGGASGRVTLLACDVSQASFESEQFRNGVFTHYLLDGLRGQAKTDDRGFVTVGTLVDYISQQVHDWVVREKPGLPEPERQRPGWVGPNEARMMPLVVNTQSVLVLDKLRSRRDDARKLLFDASQKTEFKPKLRGAKLGEILGAFDDLDLSLQGFDTSSLGILVDMTENLLTQPTVTKIEAYLTWWDSSGRDLLSGVLKVASVPTGAVVLVDQIEVGKTPMTKKLPAGAHVVTVSRVGYEKTTRPITIAAGQTEDLEAIALRALPNARHAEFANPGPFALTVGKEFRQALKVENGTLEVTDLPPGITFNPQTRLLSGTPSKTGDKAAKVTVIDESGETTPDTLVFKITPPTEEMTPPVVKDAAEEIMLGQTFEFTIRAKPSNSVTKYGASNLPPGLKIDPKSGRISGTPENSGDYTISISATNEAGQGGAELHLKVLEEQKAGSEGSGLGRLGKYLNDLERKEEEDKALTRPTAGPKVAYTFVITGTMAVGMGIVNCVSTEDGRVLLPDGRQIGRVMTPIFPNTIGQLYFPNPYNYYVQVGADGNLYSVYRNGYWQPYGTWRKNR